MIKRIAGLIAATSFLAGCTGDTPVSEPQRPEAGTVDSQSFAKIPDVVRRLEPSVVTVFTRQGSGSGVVYKSDGVIVTNAHVVGQATQTQIGFADGQRTQGTVVVTDEVTDLALIRTERKRLPAAKFATALPAPGERVLAMGTPLGFANSVTAGIVSGLGREIAGSAPRTRALVDLIQTDAAISPAGRDAEAATDEGTSREPVRRAVQMRGHSDWGTRMGDPATERYMVVQLPQGSRRTRSFVDRTPNTDGHETDRRGTTCTPRHPLCVFAIGVLEPEEVAEPQDTEMITVLGACHGCGCGSACLGRCSSR